MEATKLRLRLRMNNRLRLEAQALLSKLFREHDVPVGDELLSRLIFAVPDELLIEGEAVGASEMKPPPKPPTKNTAHVRKPPPKPPTKKGGENPPPKPPTKHGVLRGFAKNPPPKPPTKK